MNIIVLWLLTTAPIFASSNLHLVSGITFSLVILPAVMFLAMVLLVQKKRNQEILWYL